MTNIDLSRLFTIVLAAGGASRFGSTKQLANYDGRTLVQHAIEIATGCTGANTLLVLGHDWQDVARSCGVFPGFFVVNERYQDGLGTSLSLAMRSLDQAASAVLVVLADQPLVSAVHLAAIRDAWSGRDSDIVATEFGDTLGPPVLYPRACFADLAALNGDAGGKHLLGDDRFNTTTLRFDDAAVDIDTPDDLRRISRSARS